MANPTTTEVQARKILDLIDAGKAADVLGLGPRCNTCGELRPGVDVGAHHLWDHPDEDRAEAHGVLQALKASAEDSLLHAAYEEIVRLREALRAGLRLVEPSGTVEQRLWALEARRR